MWKLLKRQSRTALADRDDMELMSLYQSGNEEAIGTLFQRHYRELFHLAHAMLIDKVYADELISLVLEEYLNTPRRQRKKKYNIRSSARGFLRTTVSRRCIDHNRKKSNQVRTARVEEKELRHMATWAIAGASSFADKLCEFEAGEMMARILDRLAGKERDIFHLHAQGYSREEICSMLRMTTPGNVSSALYNARKKAKEVLLT